MMKKVRGVSIVVLLLASIAGTTFITATASVGDAVFFAGNTSVAGAFQQTVPWRTFSSAEGKFSLLMPIEPKVEVQDVDSSVGKLTMYSYTSSTSTAYLMASYGDYPNEPVDADHIEQVLDGVQSGVLGSIAGEKLSGNKIVLKGRAISGAAPVEYPGREFTGKKMQDGGSEIFFSWRVYLVGRRLYPLAVVTNKANAASPDVAKFLTSFQLTN